VTYGETYGGREGLREGVTYGETYGGREGGVSTNEHKLWTTPGCRDCRSCKTAPVLYTSIDSSYRIETVICRLYWIQYITSN